MSEWCAWTSPRTSRASGTDLAAAAEAGGPEAKAAAERLALALDPAVRLALMDALSQAAAEITAELPRRLGRRPAQAAASRVRGRRTHDAAPAPTAPPRRAHRRRPRTPRRTTRTAASPGSPCGIPESVKYKAEELAAKGGHSLNSWIVNVVRAATRERRDQRRHRPVQHPVPRRHRVPARPAAGSQADDRLGLSRPPRPHHTDRRPPARLSRAHPRPDEGSTMQKTFEHPRPDRRCTSRSAPATSPSRAADTDRDRRRRRRQATPSDVVVEQRGDEIVVIAPKHRAGLFGGGSDLSVRVALPTGSRARHQARLAPT